MTVDTEPTGQSAPTPAETLSLLTRLSTSQDRSEVLTTVAESAASLLDADRVSVGLLVDDDPDTIEIVALSGVDDVLQRGTLLRVADLTLRECLESGKPVSFRPSEKDGKDAVALKAAGFTTAVNAPLVAATRCYGTLNVGYREKHPDVDSAALLAQLLASQLDRIDSRVRLEAELVERRRESQRWNLVRQIDLRLPLAETVEQVVSSVGELARQLVPDARVAFIELDHETGEVDMVDSERHGVDLDQAQLSLLIDKIVESSANYYPDLVAEPVAGLSAALVGPATRSVLCIAVDGRGGTSAVLVIASDVADGIAPTDRDMLIAVAPLIGGAIERIEVDARLAFSADHDQLTGLIRRSRFDALLEAEIAERAAHVSDDAASVLVSLDVDRFKVVNDTEGHTAGDEFLIELSSRLQRLLGPTDLVTRVGADEFVILLRDRERAEYQEVCEHIVSSVAAVPFIVGGRSVAGSVSVGYAFVDKSATSARDIMGQADAACYTAKMQGGNVALPALSHDLRQSARRNASRALVQLRRALDEDKLILYGQPVVELSSMELMGHEVLVRMHGADGELITPNQFIPIAERYHAIEDLDAWVVRRALFRLGQCVPGNEHEERLFINLSPTSITSAGFADRIESIVSESSIDPSRITFEITETGTMKSFDEALAFVKQISAMGSRIALDDFGVGLSSLSHLQLLPVDVLKIDGSLVVGIENNPLNTTMVTTIKAMADALGIITIAEFIENPDALEQLRTIGIHCGQGYFLGRPDVLCDQLTRQVSDA